MEFTASKFRLRRSLNSSFRKLAVVAALLVFALKAVGLRAEQMFPFVIPGLDAPPKGSVVDVS